MDIQLIAQSSGALDVLTNIFENKKSITLYNNPHAQKTSDNLFEAGLKAGFKGDKMTLTVSDTDDRKRYFANVQAVMDLLEENKVVVLDITRKNEHHVCLEHEYDKLICDY